MDERGEGRGVRENLEVIREKGEGKRERKKSIR